MKHLLTFLLACLIPAISNAQINQPKEIKTSQTFGAYTVHYNVFNSKMITGQIADTYKLTRAKDIALINISLTKTQDSKTSLGLPAKITVKAINLMQQTKSVVVKEIKETDATYYLASLRHTNEEDYRFEITAVPEGEQKPLVVSFTRRLFTEN